VLFINIIIFKLYNYHLFSSFQRREKKFINILAAVKVYKISIKYDDKVSSLEIGDENGCIYFND